MQWKVKRDKKKWMEDLVREVEDAAEAFYIRELYTLSKRIAEKNKSNSMPVRDKEYK